MTTYEAELILHLVEELNPKHCVSSLSMKTDPLSDTSKGIIRWILELRGYRAEFPIEDVPHRNAAGDLEVAPQHFIRVVTAKTG